MIARFGEKINHPDSVYYWAFKNQIPVLCPALTDGSLGDQIYFHSINNCDNPLVIDIASDIRLINDLAVSSKKTGQIILGGGIVKHHICNANLMRNGADFSVYINTGQEFDGSDSGAHPEEAVSWGKIRMDAHPVKVFADASLVFPLLVAQTFAKAVHSSEHNKAACLGCKHSSQSLSQQNQQQQQQQQQQQHATQSDKAATNAGSKTAVVESAGRGKQKTGADF
jgi:deoxyhypusine synthase